MYYLHPKRMDLGGCVFIFMSSITLWLRFEDESFRGRGECDVRAFTTYIGNSILIMENSGSGGCETLETPNIFIFPGVLSFITILIWSSFILERFVL